MLLSWLLSEDAEEYTNFPNLLGFFKGSEDESAAHSLRLLWHLLSSCHLFILLLFGSTSGDLPLIFPLTCASGFTTGSTRSYAGSATSKGSSNGSFSKGILSLSAITGTSGGTFMGIFNFTRPDPGADRLSIQHLGHPHPKDQLSWVLDHQLCHGMVKCAWCVPCIPYQVLWFLTLTRIGAIHSTTSNGPIHWFVIFKLFPGIFLGDKYQH